MENILVGTPATLSVTFYVDGEADDPGVVAVSVTNLAGAVVASENASGTGATARTLALTTTHTADLDTLTAQWTSPTLGVLTTYVEIVGDLLFTETEARAFKPRTGASGTLASTTNYPDAVIANARARIAEDFTEILGVVPYPRYKLVTLDGDGSGKLLLPDLLPTALRSVETRTFGTQIWTAFTADELADTLVTPWGELVRESLGCFPQGVQIVRIGYEYGLERVPAPIKQAALLVLTGADAQSVNATDIDFRAISFDGGAGTIRFLTPGLGRGDVWYSQPDVNRILQTYRQRVPGIA